MATDICHCGKPLHYESQLLRKMVETAIRQNGEFAQVVYEGKRYLVPRHYIALHGLKGSDVPHLGFREIQLVDKKRSYDRRFS